jgi:2-succinyl-5-enolpyruvyl-6-hydroxy-3-cyclohexene-1-carboxylate synthase
VNASMSSPGPTTPLNKELAFARALFQELVASGVAHLCLCPGSRSAPLSLAAAETQGLRTWVHLDERSASFFALGLAKASRSPVAILCTSGTAAANFLPAIVEAHYDDVPLVVLTADRPPELRECGAGQTIDQQRLYGSHVRWFSEAALPDASSAKAMGDLLRYARSLACRAVATALGNPAGPVHLNLPFREPLHPVAVPPDIATLKTLAAREPIGVEGREDKPYLAVHQDKPAPSRTSIENLADAITQMPKGIIVAGPDDSDPTLPTAVARLARVAGWPVLADAASQLRFGPHIQETAVLSHYDLFLRNPAFADAAVPDFVLRLGASPTSKAYRLWMEQHPRTHIALVDVGSRWHDPSHLATDLFRCDPTALCHHVAERLEKRQEISADFAARDAWLARWRQADKQAASAIHTVLESSTELLEPHVGSLLSELLPDPCQLFLSSSMPIRDIDCFASANEKSIRVHCNRGANGIDGVTSSALGVSAAVSASAASMETTSAKVPPTVLLIGDLAFLHDLGGLFATHQYHLDATLIVINNNGGGIFSFLPVADSADPKTFDKLFTLPHGIQLESAAALYGIGYQRIENLSSFERQLAISLQSPGTQLLELVVSREASVAQHRRIVDTVTASLSDSGKSDAETSA